MSYYWRYRGIHRSRRDICIRTAIATTLITALLFSLRIGPGSSGASTPVPSRVGIYSATQQLRPVADADPNSVELGVKFTVSVPGTIVAVRFYRAAANSGPHSGSVWSDSGALLATTHFRNGTAGTWQVSTLSRPVPVKPGRTYVVSYHTNVGHYASQTGTFSNGKTIGVSPYITGHAGVYLYGPSGYPTQSWRNSSYFVDAMFAPAQPQNVASTAASSSTHPATTVSPAPSASPAVNSFPNASNTGIPQGTVLSKYTGPMTITAANTVVDGKTITGDLRIRAAGVVVQNSQVNGDVRIDADDYGKGFSFTIRDSNVNAGRPLGQDAYDGTGIEAVNFNALRVNVVGGKLSINCFNTCTIQDSWLHAQATDSTGVTHEGGIRVGQSANVLHNTIACEGQNVAPNAGCSGDFTGYGDFGPVQNVLAQSNYFVAETSGGGICAYGGSSAGKPYSADANHIRFINNTFGKSATNDHGDQDCAYYAAVTDFDSSAPGNVFTGNVYTDGTAVKP